MKFIIKLGGPVVKNSPTNAGPMDLISDPEDPTCLRATKPMCLNYRACFTSSKYLIYLSNIWTPSIC